MDNICTRGIALEVAVVKLVFHGVMINHRSYKQAKLSCMYNCDGQIYDISYIHLHSSPSADLPYITNSQCDQLPDGLIAQSVEHCTGIADVMGSNPVQA